MLLAGELKASVTLRRERDEKRAGREEEVRELGETSVQ
jgi:hypothetical protein